MKVLVIPDVHLKSWIFDKAEKILLTYNHIDNVVCLGDLVDDFGQDNNLGLYEETLNRAIQFATDFPNTLWCYGNHDISYLWNQYETGFSHLAIPVVTEGMAHLKREVGNKLQFIHRIDNVLFSHAGLIDNFVKMVSKGKIDNIINDINTSGMYYLWSNESVLWTRPQYEEVKMYKPKKYLQVVGHTPMKTITKTNNLISCDVFSTHTDGIPYGDRTFLVVDTETWDCEIIEQLN